MGLPHHSAARRVRLRHLAEGRLEVRRRRQRVGRRLGGREARDGLRGDRIGVVRLLRRQPARRQPVRRLRAGARRAHRRARLALPGASSTTCGTATSPRRRAWSRSRATAGSVDAVAQITQDTATSTCSTATTGEPLFPDRGAQGAAASRWRGERRRATQPLPTLPPPFARQRSHRRHAHDAHAGGARGACSTRSRKLRKRGAVRTRRAREGTIIFPGVDGGAEWGGAAFDPAIGPALRQRERDGVDGEAWLRACPTVTGTARRSTSGKCASCHRDGPARQPAGVPVARGHRRPAQCRRRSPTSIRQGAGRMPAFPDMRRRDVDAIVEFLVTGRSRRASTPTTPTPFDLKYRCDGDSQVPDPDGYPRDHAAVGHAERHRPEHRRRIAWKIPFGEYPELAARASRTPAATTTAARRHRGRPALHRRDDFDRKFHAFDKLTGKLLWETTLPAAGNATPAIYEVNGKRVRRRSPRRRQVRRAVRRQLRRLRAAPAIELVGCPRRCGCSSSGMTPSRARACERWPSRRECSIGDVAGRGRRPGGDEADAAAWDVGARGVLDGLRDLATRLPAGRPLERRAGGEALAAGARAVLLRDRIEDRLLPAVPPAAAGLVALDEGLAESVLRPRPAPRPGPRRAAHPARDRGGSAPRRGPHEPPHRRAPRHQRAHRQVPRERDPREAGSAEPQRSRGPGRPPGPRPALAACPACPIGQVLSPPDG